MFIGEAYSSGAGRTFQSQGSREKGRPVVDRRLLQQVYRLAVVSLKQELGVDVTRGTFEKIEGRVPGIDLGEFERSVDVEVRTNGTASDELLWQALVNQVVSF
ncbi:MAG: hypothetical protein ABIE84_07175 [bacterium]